MVSGVSVAKACVHETLWLTCFPGRLARQTFSGSSQKIAEFKQSLISLKQSFDSGSILHTAFVSTRTLEGVEKLGACNASMPSLPPMLTQVFALQSDQKT